MEIQFQFVLLHHDQRASLFVRLFVWMFVCLLRILGARIRGAEPWRLLDFVLSKTQAPDVKTRAELGQLIGRVVPSSLVINL